MDMFDGVGRRRDQTSGQLVNIGEHSLNGNERNCLFRNNGDGTFTDVGYIDEADRIEDGRGLAILDYNEDGQLDVALRNYLSPAQLLRNTGGMNHWLQVQLVGTQSNRDAVGARIAIVAGGRTQVREVHCGSGFVSASSLVQHFGLGPVTHVDSLRVRWPSGAETQLVDLDVDRRLRVVEGEGLAAD